jgi:pilus assembly protein CpaD
MKFSEIKFGAGSSTASTIAKRALLATVMTLALAGCKHMEEATQLAGWTLVDPSQRHPIIVSEQPTHLSVRVSRGSSGLTKRQRVNIVDFLGHFRSAANSRLTIAVPSGSRNEVAAMAVVGEIRALAADIGFGEASMVIQPYHDEGRSQPPVRLTFSRYVAEGPDCGRWPTNLGTTHRNLTYPNFGCAMQHNLAAMVANPGDLLGPRTMTAGPAERRDAQWDLFVAGKPTGARKSKEEKLKVKGSE